jgi:hypothetical protein
MPILVDCPVCNTRLRVPNYAAGRFTKCTACGNGLRVPQPKKMLEKGEDDADDDDDEGSRKDRGQAEKLAPSDLSQWSMEKLSAFTEWLTDRPLRAVMAGLIVVVISLGVTGAKWALNKPVDNTIVTVEPEDTEPWDGVGTTDANDRVRVTMQSANTEPIEVIPINQSGARKTPRAYFRVVLKIDNLSPDELKYTGWAIDSGHGEHPATLKDDTGNSHKQVYWTSRIVGQTTSAKIKPGESITDVLVFEPTGTYAKYLKLSLPAESCGGTGLLRIKIPRTRVLD